MVCQLLFLCPVTFCFPLHFGIHSAARGNFLKYISCSVILLLKTFLCFIKFKFSIKMRHLVIWSLPVFLDLFLKSCAPEKIKYLLLHGYYSLFMSLDLSSSWFHCWKCLSCFIFLAVSNNLVHLSSGIKSIMCKVIFPHSTWRTDHSVFCVPTNPSRNSSEPLLHIIAPIGLHIQALC